MAVASGAAALQAQEAKRILAAIIEGYSADSSAVDAAFRAMASSSQEQLGSSANSISGTSITGPAPESMMGDVDNEGQIFETSTTKASNSTTDLHQDSD